MSLDWSAPTNRRERWSSAVCVLRYESFLEGCTAISASVPGNAFQIGSIYIDLKMYCSSLCRLDIGDEALGTQKVAIRLGELEYPDANQRLARSVRFLHNRMGV